MYHSSTPVSDDSSLWIHRLPITRTNNTLCPCGHRITSDRNAQLVQSLCCTVKEFGVEYHQTSVGFWQETLSKFSWHTAIGSIWMRTTGWTDWIRSRRISGPRWQKEKIRRHIYFREVVGIITKVKTFMFLYLLNECFESCENKTGNGCHMVRIEAAKESSQSGTASFKGVAETLASKVISARRVL